MLKLPIPVFDEDAVLNACTSGLTQNAAINRYQTARPDLNNAYAIYKSHANSRNLHLIPQGQVTQTLKSSLLIGLYQNHLAKKGELARDFYDRLMEIPPDETCPLCGLRKVSTIDHHLPKVKYPIYSIFSKNLIACCAECNRLKGENIPLSQLEQTLHPYFDNPNADKWLFAEIIPGSPMAAAFKAEVPRTINHIIAARIEYQFRTLELGKLYSSYAASEISQIKRYVIKTRKKRGIDGVKYYFEDMFESCKEDHNNSWKTALYEALSLSDWAIHNSYK